MCERERERDVTVLLLISDFKNAVFLNISLLILYLWFYFSGLTDPTPNPGGGKKIFELRERDYRRYMSNYLDEREKKRERWTDIERNGE